MKGGGVGRLATEYKFGASTPDGRALTEVARALCMEYLGVRIGVTYSIGIGTLKQHVKTLDELRFVAYKYLNLAKEMGRNRVFSCQPISLP